MAALVISTQRLALSQLVASDAPMLYAYRSDPEVCRFQSFEPSTLSVSILYILLIHVQFSRFPFRAKLVSRAGDAKRAGYGKPDYCGLHSEP